MREKEGGERKKKKKKKRLDGWRPQDRRRNPNSLQKSNNSIGRMEKSTHLERNGERSQQFRSPF
ncbi:hypothetical protein SAY87_007806 [Trapa incisa]|uniref:Uncharacterized protein n=1 Tax=Trapa incisa TaxID=236973 RepID=A0AAN7KEZ9_9MYRT|nr:hypothetical protein SAY87_007806 [Trapa incisa]